MSEQTEVVASLKLDSAQAEGSVKSFKAQLREANQELLSMAAKFGETSKEAVIAAKRIAEIKDAMGDAKALTDAFNPDRKFQAFSATLSGVAGGFSAVQGAMALVGAEGEDVQKTLVKVQAALALSQGVNSVLELKDTFKQLGAFIQQTTVFQKANDLATKAAAVTQKLFRIEVDTTSTSFKLLKGAIAATGIGLAVVAIGEIVAITQEWTSATDKQIEAQKELKEETKKLADIGLKGEQDFIGRQEKLDVARAKARGATEKEIFKIQESWQQSRINSQKRHYQEVSKVDEVAGQESIQQVKNLQTDLQVQQLTFQADQRKKAEEAEKKRQEKAKADAAKRKEELKAALERERAAEADLRKMREDNYLLEEKDKIQSGRSKIIIDAENEKARINNLQISEGLRLQLLAEVRRKEHDQLIEYDKQITDEKKEKDKERLKANLQYILDQAKINQEQVAAQNEIRKEINDQQLNEFDLQLETLDDKYKKQLDIVGTNEALQNQLIESYEKQRTAITFAENQQRLEIVSGVLGKAADLFGKQTAAGKVLAIAEATINTYTGATAALRSKVPFPEPYATGVRIAQAALIIATGLKSIREIAKTQIPGGGGGSASTAAASISSATAPITTTPTVQTTQLDQQSINDLGDASKNQRAWVLESDITSKQELNTRLQRAAVLGGH
jgi:hypothetical protein